MAGKKAKQAKTPKAPRPSKSRKAPASREPATGGWGQYKDRLRLILGAFFAGVGIYTLVALSSYLLTWSIDQSLLGEDSVLGVLAAENAGGRMGFYWGNLLVGKLFGIGAFVIPLFFLALAILCLRIRRIRVLPVFLLSAFGCVLLSLTCSFIFGFTPWKYLFGNGPGGTYGYYVNHWLITQLGATGAGLLIAFALLTWLSLLSHRFVRALLSWRRPGPAVAAPSPEDVGPAKPEAQREADTETEMEIEAEPEAEPEAVPEAEPEVEPDTAGHVGPQKEAKQPTFVMETPEGKLPEANDPEEEAAEARLAEESLVDAEYQAAMRTASAPKAEALPRLEVEEVPEENELPAGSLETIYDPRLDLSLYKSPDFSLLKDYQGLSTSVTREECERNSVLITNTLRDYKIPIEQITAVPGPTVTLYKVVPSPGVRIAQIKRLVDDIAMSLAARGVRVIAPIPATNAVGIEVANERPAVVSMRSVLDSQKFKNADFDLPVALGKTISNEVYAFDLAKMPHLLVAGATGQGKSVGLNAIITSLLYKMHPAFLKLVLIDPKKVELSLYAKLEKHFLAKLPDMDEAIITDTKKVVHTLQSLCIEMDTRYDLLKAAQVRNIKEYNAKFLNRRLNPLKGHRFMPFIVVVIDEFSDLIITAGREVEDPLTRLAQLARAIGIHLVIATQRPTANVITGLIKSNFTARIAFRVISSMDSRTILDQTGANQLVGKGDMLISTGGDMTRVQCAFVDTPEVEQIVDFISRQQGYPQTYELPQYEDAAEDNGAKIDQGPWQRDEMFAEAARLIVQTQQGSTSLIQRRMNLGYNRAGRIMDQMETAGIVGPQEGSKPRQVLVYSEDALDKILEEMGL